MVNAFVCGESGAYGKVINRDEQGIKVQQLAVPERMERIRRSAAALHPEEKQEFVAGVRRGVKGFREHRGAASNGGRGVLANCDGNIGRDRGEYHLAGSGRRHLLPTLINIKGMSAICRMSGCAASVR